MPLESDPRLNLPLARSNRSRHCRLDETGAYKYDETKYSLRMSSIELTTGVALLGGVDLVYPVALVATAFLVLSMAFFTVVAVGPYVKLSAITEEQKNAAIGLGAALAGALWMVAIMLGASYLS